MYASPHNCSLQRLSFSARLEKYKDTVTAAPDAAAHDVVDEIERGAAAQRRVHHRLVRVSVDRATAVMLQP